MFAVWVAYIAVAAAQIGVAVASSWYLYGLWPSSWWTFIWFTLVLAALAIISKAIEKEL